MSAEFDKIYPPKFTTATASPVITMNGHTVTVHCPDCGTRSDATVRSFPDVDLMHVCTVDGRLVWRGRNSAVEL